MRVQNRWHILLPIAALVLALYFFPWFLEYEGPPGRGFYLFEECEKFSFNRIELNLTNSIPRASSSKMTNQFLPFQHYSEASIQMSFNVMVGPNSGVVGFVSPWRIGSIDEKATSPLRWRIEHIEESSIVYAKFPKDYNDIATLGFSVKSKGLRRVSYSEFSVILPFPPLGQRMETSDLEKKIGSMIGEVHLLPMPTRFKVGEEADKYLPTFIEMDIPPECLVREVHPFYSVGMGKNSYFLSWDSRELRMLSRGSYSGSILVTLEEPSYKSMHEFRVFLSSILSGFFLSRIIESLLTLFRRFKMKKGSGKDAVSSSMTEDSASPKPAGLQRLPICLLPSAGRL